ncbi:hypothetical protein ACFVJS_13730 [Nocardioides sp. NPDC057772]|uniref:hypothetical protein n=1 Tax=Nocardioides sp. NPDC057772 TaxID=3346245 RepID=UPI00366D54BA
MSEPRDDQEETEENGQISDVQQMDPEVAGRPIAPSDSTADHPESEPEEEPDDD